MYSVQYAIKFIAAVCTLLLLIMSHGRDFENARFECPESKCMNGVCLSTYSLYLIGLFYFFLLIIIAVLAYLLYLNKSNQYLIMKTPDATLQRNFSPQISHDTSDINLDVLHKKKGEENYTLHILDESKPQNQQNDHNKKTNVADKHILITKELKQHRPLKKNSNHNIILKDEINKICQNELSKSQANGNNTSLKDLHKLIYEDRQNVASICDSKKSLSTSQMDEFYDEVPNRRPVNQKNINEANITDQYYDELPKGRRVIQDNIDVSNIPIYDCPPTGKTFVYRDSTSDYLVPISRGNVSIDVSAEPEYINARY